MVNIIKNNELGSAMTGVAAVDFSATWCGPCRMLAPIMDELSEELDGKVGFYNCDVDENGGLAANFGITNIPAVAVLKDGKLIDMAVGFRPKDDIKEFILNAAD